MLKKLLHRLLVFFVPVCFNALNLLLAGNLPPFGAACVIVQDEQGHFLVVRHSRRGFSLPGGFMRWRETPRQAALRECKEETGLDIELHELIGTYSHIGKGPWQLNTLTVTYAGTARPGGTLRGSIEGQPCWMSKDEIRPVLRALNSAMMHDYFAYQRRKEAASAPSPEDSSPEN